MPGPAAMSPRAGGGWPTPLVSVVVPNYNHAPFLEQRLSSILAQGVDDMEVLVLDDASTDHSLERIAPFLADPRVRLHVNASNSGNAFSQWNRGLAMARGPYVWIAESDDCCAQGLLETLLSLLERCPTAGLAYCQSLWVDEHGVILGSLLGHTEELDANRWKSGFFNGGREELRDYLSILNTIPNVSACLFRRQALLEIGGAPTHLSLCGDWLAYARLLARRDIVFTPQPLNLFRKRAQTLRARCERDGTEIIETYRVLGEIASAVGLPPRVREHAADRAFRRLKQVAANPDLDPRSLGAMGLAPLATAFDSRFLQRLASLNTRHALLAEVFHHPSGEFNHSDKLSLNYYAGEWTELEFLVPSGRLRFDPFAHPGLMVLALLRVREASSGRTLFQAGQGRPFSGLRPAGAFHLLAEDECLLALSLEDDPAFILEGLPEGAGETMWSVSVRLLAHTGLGRHDG